MGRNIILGTVDLHLLSNKRQGDFLGFQIQHPFTEEQIKSSNSHIRGVLGSGNLSDLAEKYNLSVEIIIVLSNLCNSYKQLDTELKRFTSTPLQFYGVQEIMVVIQLLEISTMGKLYSFIEKSPGSLLLPIETIRLILTLPSNSNLGVFKKISGNIADLHFPVALRTFLNHINGINIEQQKLLKTKLTSNTQNISIIVDFCESFDDLLYFFENKFIFNVSQMLSGIKLGIILRICGNITTLEEFSREGPIIVTLDKMNDNIFEASIGQCKSTNDIKRVAKNRYLYNPDLETTKPSRVLSDMVEAQILDENGSDKRWVVSYMHDCIATFFEDQELTQLNKKNKLTKMRLNLYVRYGRQVDHPEIAEALILFTQAYIDRGYSQAFDGINVIPRHIDKKPSDEIFKHETTVFLDVQGSSFKEAINSSNTVMVYLSHSKVAHTNQCPCIVSGGMENNSINNSIVSEIELEESRSNGDFTITSSLNSIFIEFFRNLRELENMLMVKKNEEFKGTTLLGKFKELLS